MRITINKIKEYNPCKSGIDNFEALFPNYNNTLVYLLSLDVVSYSDKMWLVSKVVDYKVLQQWSVDCAEFVVDSYNVLYPTDNRVQNCIDITRKYLLGECSIDDLNVAWSAAGSVWSAAESAARSAWSAAWSAWSAEKEQEDINISLLIGLL